MQVLENALSLTGIPKYYGLKQVLLDYELVAFEDNFIVISSDVGVILCYSYRHNYAFRIPPEGYNKVTCIDLKCQTLVWGTDNGYIGVKHLEISEATLNKNKVLKKVHDTSVECVCYHGNRLASVDKDGNIALLDITKVPNSSEIVYIEQSKVTNIAFVSTELLLISTLSKACILNIGQGFVISVGTKERKPGDYGGCVLDAYTVLIARPGLRLWYANSSGQVLKTIQLKKVLSDCSLSALSPDIDKAVRLSTLLPKSGTINRVERIDDKLIVIQCGSIFVFLETVALSVVGWSRENVHDWCVASRSIVMLYPDHAVKMFYISSDEPCGKHDNELAGIIENKPNGLHENEPSGTNENEPGGLYDSDSREESLRYLNGTPSTAKIDIELPEVQDKDDRYQVSSEKLSEISEFVNTICERKHEEFSSGGISNQSVQSEALKPTTSSQKVESYQLRNSSEDTDAFPFERLSSDLKSVSRDDTSEDNTLREYHHNFPTTVIPDDVIQDGKSDVTTTPQHYNTVTPFDIATSVSEQYETSVPETRDRRSSEIIDLNLEDERSTEKKVIDEIKENLGKAITTFGRASSPNRTKQLIVSDVNLPLFEPDKMSLSSQETVSIYSNSTTCDEECDNTIAVSIKRKKRKVRKCKSPSSETSDLATSQVILETDLETLTLTSNTLNTDALAVRTDIIPPNTDFTTCTIECPRVPVTDEVAASLTETLLCDPSNIPSIARGSGQSKLSDKSREMTSSLDEVSTPHVERDSENIHHVDLNLFSDQTSNQTSMLKADQSIEFQSNSELNQSVYLDTRQTRETQSPGDHNSQNNSTSSVVSTNSLPSDSNLDSSLDVARILDELETLNLGGLKLDVAGLLDGPGDLYDSESDGSEDLSSEQHHASSVSTLIAPSFGEEHKTNYDMEQLKNEARIERLVNSRLGVRDGSIADMSDIYSTKSFSESTVDFEDFERRSSVELGEDPLTSDYGIGSRLSPSVRTIGQSSRERKRSRDPFSESRDRHSGSGDLHSECDTTESFMGDDSWVELRGPTMSRMYVTISSLAVSGSSVWCTDNWGHVFYSPNTRGNSLSWERVSGGKLASVSVSDSGLVVWGVATNKRAVVRLGMCGGRPSGSDWSEMMLEAHSLTVEEDAVWLLVSQNDGAQKLYFRDGVTADDPQGEKWVVVSTQNLVFSSLSAHNSVLWGVVSSGKLVIRHGITADNRLGNSWHVLPVNNVKDCHVGRDLEVGWVVDTAGIVHFQSGVNIAKPRGSNLWWQISMTEQLETNFVSHTVGLFSMKRRSLDVKQVCSSREGGVWLLSNYATLHRRYGVVSGHNWASISRTVMGGRCEQWICLAGEGAYPDLMGPVWGLSGAADIACFTRSAPPLILISPCPGVVDIAATLGVLWVLGQSGEVHVRKGVSKGEVSGVAWEALNMCQLNGIGIVLKRISCSHTGVWAVDSNGGVWYRTGLSVGGQDTVQAWLSVSGAPKFRDISAGRGGSVWAVDTKNSVYVRTGVSKSLPVGQSWEHVPGIQCLHVRAAQGGALGLSTSHRVVYRYGVGAGLPAGNYWRKIPGPPPDGSTRLLTVLPGGGMWCASNRTGLLYRRRVKTLHSQLEAAQPDDEWEVL